MWRGHLVNCKFWPSLNWPQLFVTVHLHTLKTVCYIRSCSAFPSFADLLHVFHWNLLTTWWALCRGMLWPVTVRKISALSSDHPPHPYERRKIARKHPWMSLVTVPITENSLRASRSCYSIWQQDNDLVMRRVLNYLLRLIHFMFFSYNMEDAWEVGGDEDDLVSSTSGFS